jgi:hypothetical protein
MTAPRVALVHDWLTGMRGGEKVLAVLAELLPYAPIYTLFHFPGSVVAELERHPIHSSTASTATTCRSFRRRSRTSTSPTSTWWCRPATAWPRG